MWKPYEKSNPLPVKGGIKLKSKNNDSLSAWWKQRWIQAIESFEDGARLSRGRSYARKGQTTDIKISEGMVSAKVQGSRSKPYTVTIEFETLSPHAWNLVMQAIGEKALYAAKLFAGELPKEIEALFDEIKIPLIPSHYEELSTDCTCPDWSNPCKHIAAVLYLLGEELGRDPFLLFQVKGIDRKTFMQKIEQYAAASEETPHEEEEEKLPLTLDPHFWSCSDLPPDYLANAFEKGKQNGALLKSLGKFPFWRGSKDLTSFLEPVYANVSKEALDMLDKQSK